MSDLPPSAGMSPDGKWRWDGMQWVPAAGAPPQAPPQAPAQAAVQRRSRSWIWLAGGCGLIAALLVAVVIGGAVFGWNSLLHRLQSGTYTCLPSDFPKYPGATFGGVSFDLNGPTRACNMMFESYDDVAAVFDFYEGALNTGGWRVVSSDRAAGRITFKSSTKAGTHGTASVAVSKGPAASHGQSEITVQIYSTG